MSSSQMVVHFTVADYQPFNGIIVKGVSKGVHSLTIIHSNTSNPFIIQSDYKYVSFTFFAAYCNSGYT